MSGRPICKKIFIILFYITNQLQNLYAHKCIFMKAIFNYLVYYFYSNDLSRNDNNNIRPNNKIVHLHYKNMRNTSTHYN